MPYVRAMDSFFDGDAKGKKVFAAAATDLTINDTSRCPQYQMPNEKTQK